MISRIRITRVDLWSLFKVAFLLYAGIGVIVGLFYWFVLMVVGSLGTVFTEEEIPGLGMLGGVLGVFLVPIMAFFYGAFSSVMITIGAALFNVAVRFTDGLAFEADVETETPPPAATTAPAAPTLPPAGPGDPI